MKVLLINPWQGEVFPTPAIGYLASAIRKARPDVDITSADMNRALQLLGTNEYDLIGATFHSFSVKYARQIRQAVKRGRLICGGHHPSAMPEQMLNIGYDSVVVGEGENAILNELGVEGITYPDIDSIPFPDYTGLSWSGAMGIPIISSRGCPFTCSFCASTAFWGRRWKMRSANNVISEIEHTGMKLFMLEDDNFTVNRKRVFEICDALIGRGFTWQCASRGETLQDEELCHKLKEAGCHTVWVGVESLSQDSLDRNKKNTTVEKMLKGIATAESQGLNTMSQFIIGLPDDTQRDIDLTVRNIKGSKIRRRGLQKLWIVPNTEAYKRAKAKGFDDETFLVTGAPYYTYEQSMETLNKWESQIQNA